MGKPQKGRATLKCPSATWKTEDKKWMKNGNTSKTDMLSIFQSFLISFLAPFFLSFFWKMKSKMRTVNTHNRDAHSNVFRLFFNCFSLHFSAVFTANSKIFAVKTDKKQLLWTSTPWDSGKTEEKTVFQVMWHVGSGISMFVLHPPMCPSSELLAAEILPLFTS